MPDDRLPLPKSLYAETARAAIATPPLAGDARASVAIVGGGYTGLSAALHLAGRGIDAMVLEAHEPGWGASGRNGGQVNPGIYPDPDRVIADFGAEVGQRMLSFASAAPDLVFDLVKRHGIDCEAEQTGTLRVAFNARKLAAARATLAQLQQTGSPAQWIDREGLAAATGTKRYLGGIRFPQGGKLNPLGYARGLAEAAQQAGAHIHGGTPALRIEQVNGGWLVRTPAGRVTAETLVLATNGYTGDLWPGLRQTLVPVYSTIAATQPLSPEMAAGIMPGGGVLYEAANITVYYRLDRRNRLLMGGRSVQRDAPSFTDGRHLIGYATRLWPQLRDVDWSHIWNGKVAITTDHHIHLHEPAPGVHICLGYNGRGVAMATAMGGVLARRIAGAAAADLPMPVTGMKPILFHGFAKAGVALRIANGRLRDALGW